MRRRPSTFVVVGLSALSVALLTARQPPPAPALLLQGMKSVPEVRLLTPATDLREYSQARLQKLGYWPPWLELDLDRDKLTDVVAVVVQASPSGPLFGVAAVHARAPNEVEWVVPLDLDPINGVAKGPAADVIVPLFCVECDANTWLRWSGEEYEAELYAVGERVDIGGETQADVPLYSSPNLASKPVTTETHCTTVTIRKVAGTPALRWYFVETPEGQRGWISDRVISSSICIG